MFKSLIKIFKIFDGKSQISDRVGNLPVSIGQFCVRDLEISDRITEIFDGKNEISARKKMKSLIGNWTKQAKPDSESLF
jgi:hypothetical protein